MFRYDHSWLAACNLTIVMAVFGPILNLLCYFQSGATAADPIVLSDEESPSKMPRVIKSPLKLLPAADFQLVLVGIVKFVLILLCIV